MTGGALHKYNRKLMLVWLVGDWMVDSNSDVKLLFTGGQSQRDSTHLIG